MYIYISIKVFQFINLSVDEFFLCILFSDVHNQLYQDQVGETC